MKAVKFLLILFFILCCGNSCEKIQLSHLPPETQRGANTFGCRIDGEIYVYINEKSFWKNLWASYDTVCNTLILDASLKSKNGSTHRIYI